MAGWEPGARILSKGADVGYTTNFDGRFQLDKCLTVEQFNELKDFRSHDHRSEDYCPSYGFYCQWVPTEDGKAIQWDGSEKFYSYDEWLGILIEKFFKPWGVKITGQVRYSGEEWNDTGLIIVNDDQTVEKKQIGYIPKDISTALDEAIEAVDEEDNARARGILEGIKESLKTSEVTGNP